MRKLFVAALALMLLAAWTPALFAQDRNENDRRENDRRDGEKRDDERRPDDRRADDERKNDRRADDERKNDERKNDERNADDEREWPNDAPEALHGLRAMIDGKIWRIGEHRFVLQCIRIARMEGNRAENVREAIRRQLVIWCRTRFQVEWLKHRKEGDRVRVLVRWNHEKKRFEIERLSNEPEAREGENRERRDGNADERRKQEEEAARRAAEERKRRAAEEEEARRRRAEEERRRQANGGNNNGGRNRR